MLGSLEAVAYHATRNLVLNKATKISCRIKTHDSAHRQLNTEPLTLRRLMSYIYGAPVLDVSRSHTTTQHSR